MTEKGGSAPHEEDDPWHLFEQRLAAYFSTMRDPVDEDRVMFYIPTSSPASLGKINVFTLAQGTALQATMAGDYTTRSVSEAADLARAVREVVERRYGLPHPDLVTVTAQGPAASGAAALRLPAHGRARPSPLVDASPHVPNWGGPAHDAPEDATGAAWTRFELRLAAYLSTMTDPGERDHLVLKVPAGADGAAPYAQFAGFGDGQALRAELSGSAYVAPDYRVSAEKQANLRFLGWAGDDDAEPNLFIHWSLDDTQTVAGMVTWVLRDDFHVTHPDRLTANAWGPAASNVGVLGLSPAVEDDNTAGDEGLFELRDVPAHADSLAAAREAAQLLHEVPSGHEQLRSLVAEALRPRFGSPLRVDEDDDFVLTHLNQFVFVRVRRDEPVVELLAQVVCDVRSRRQTAIELSLLNRDHDWVKWSLSRRVVWQSLLIPGDPFSAKVFNDLRVTFFNAMTLTRDDLVLRLGGRRCP